MSRPVWYQYRNARCAACGGQFERHCPRHLYCPACAKALAGIPRAARLAKLKQIRDQHEGGSAS